MDVPRDWGWTQVSAQLDFFCKLRATPAGLLMLSYVIWQSQHPQVGAKWLSWTQRSSLACASFCSSTPLKSWPAPVLGAATSVFLTALYFGSLASLRKHQLPSVSTSVSSALLMLVPSIYLYSCLL